jgi:hypothetical protein
MVPDPVQEETVGEAGIELGSAALNYVSSYFMNSVN